jgi:hypothetical protein
LGGGTLQLHLVLFDFSLADPPAETVCADAVPYLDPFLALRKPPRWDTHTERFAAAVTLHQMATGALPTWGDGQSDPVVIDDEVTLDTAAFDATLRQTMTAFFEKALKRDHRQHFDNAQDMLAPGAMSLPVPPGRRSAPTTAKSAPRAPAWTRPLSTHYFPRSACRPAR